MRPHYTDRAGMNRAYRARVIFAPYYRLLNELQTGEVTALDDAPAMEWEGEYELAAPVLHGFVAIWERIQRDRPCGIDLAALTHLATQLEPGAPLTERDLLRARESLDACLRAYKRLPLTLIARHANTEEMAIKLHALVGNLDQHPTAPAVR
ncbi:hypothetical protein PA01_12660 [Azoarcus sp. PA01]|nr:hypothetical protein PA01_12660 [Azoarcus sp. PA01]